MVSDTQKSKPTEMGKWNYDNMTQTQQKWWTLKTYLPEMHMMKKSVTDIAIISELEDGFKGKNLDDNGRA